MIEVNALLEIFKKNFPHEKIKSVQEREGQDHLVVEINHTFMCKSAKRPEGVALLEREYKVLQKLQGKITTQIPVPLYFEENFLVYKKITGSPLFSYMFYHLGNKQQANLVVDVAKFLFELHHALSAEEIEALGIGSSNWPWSFEKLQQHKYYLETQPESLELFDSMMQLYQKMESEKNLTLVHGDFHFKNIIVDALTGQLKGVIDFTDVAYDTPMTDLRFNKHVPHEFSQALAFMYSSLTKTYIETDQLYTYYFATEWSRYFQYLDDKDEKNAQLTFKSMIEVLQDLAGTHDECKKKGFCVHRNVQKTENQPESVM